MVSYGKKSMSSHESTVNIAFSRFDLERTRSSATSRRRAKENVLNVFVLNEAKSRQQSEFAKRYVDCTAKKNELPRVAYEENSPTSQEKRSKELSSVLHGATLSTFALALTLSRQSNQRRKLVTLYLSPLRRWLTYGCVRVLYKRSCDRHFISLLSPSTLFRLPPPQLCVYKCCHVKQ